jgi:flavin-dependent dehydrogenase
MSYDALVFGAGSSGSTVARYIASNGFRVLILERKKLGREKAFAGGISERVIKEFEIILNKDISSI